MNREGTKNTKHCGDIREEITHSYLCALRALVVLLLLPFAP
jgi:hypothetical protein